MNVDSGVRDSDVRDSGVRDSGVRDRHPDLYRGHGNVRRNNVSNCSLQYMKILQAAVQFLLQPYLMSSNGVPALMLGPLLRVLYDQSVQCAVCSVQCTV